MTAAAAAMRQVLLPQQTVLQYTTHTVEGGALGFASESSCALVNIGMHLQKLL
jgi:hypothetical protein